MVRKRAPGGGRKPKGGHSVAATPFSLRLPGKVREKLAAAAAARGWTVSEEILERLKQGFDDEQRGPTWWALSHILGVAIAIVKSAGGPDWRSDPWSFRAFRLAFAQILDALEPPGEIRAPATQGAWAPTGAISLGFQLNDGTPEEMAHFIRNAILTRAVLEEPFEVSRYEEDSASGNVFERRMVDAFRALKLKEPNQ
jgi:Arc-like DNA binding domain